MINLLPHQKEQFIIGVLIADVKEDKYVEEYTSKVSNILPEEKFHIKVKLFSMKNYENRIVNEFKSYLLHLKLHYFFVEKAVVNEKKCGGFSPSNEMEWVYQNTWNILDTETWSLFNYTASVLKERTCASQICAPKYMIANVSVIFTYIFCKCSMNIFRARLILWKSQYFTFPLLNFMINVNVLDKNVFYINCRLHGSFWHYKLKIFNVHSNFN